MRPPPGKTVHHIGPARATVPLFPQKEGKVPIMALLLIYASDGDVAFTSIYSGSSAIKAFLACGEMYPQWNLLPALFSLSLSASLFCSSSSAQRYAQEPPLGRRRFLIFCSCVLSQPWARREISPRSSGRSIIFTTRPGLYKKDIIRYNGILVFLMVC